MEYFPTVGSWLALGVAHGPVLSPEAHEIGKRAVSPDKSLGSWVL